MEKKKCIFTIQEKGLGQFYLQFKQTDHFEFPLG